MPLPSQRAQPQRDDDGVFRILTVCTGNICRSPQAEQLLRARIPAAFGRGSIEALEVASAGTMGMDGRAMDAAALAEAERMGVRDAHEHRARRMQEAHVQRADLVLGLSREHRGAAASLDPSANRRAFTLVELARILEALADGRLPHELPPLGADGFSAFLHRVIAAAAAQRGQLPPPDAPEELDVVDPYRLEPEVYRESADAVEDAVQRIADSLRSIAAARW